MHDYMFSVCIEFYVKDKYFHDLYGLSVAENPQKTMYYWMEPH